MTDTQLVLKLIRETSAVSSVRAWEALMLARTPEAWAQLLRGHPVPLDQLNPDFRRRMRSRRLA